MKPRTKPIYEADYSAASQAMIEKMRSDLEADVA